MFVVSKDGTRIAFERAGSGPVVILVGGALDDGAENAPFVPALAGRFTVYNYARRGRGGSGDTPPYSVERELDDLAALIAEAGEPAHLYGVSSGGMFALEAAAAGLPVAKLALYVEGARRSPYWPGLEALAPTLAYDAALYGPPPADRLAEVTQPTLVATGGRDDFFGYAADAVAALLPNGVRATFAGQGHVADPAVVAPALAEFFGD